MKVDPILLNKVLFILRNSSCSLLELCEKHPDLPDFSTIHDWRKDSAINEQFAEVERHVAINLEREALAILDHGDDLKRDDARATARLKIAMYRRKRGDSMSNRNIIEQAAQTLTDEALKLRAELEASKRSDY